MSIYLVIAFVGAFSLGYLIGEPIGINKGLAQQMSIQKKQEAAAAFQATIQQMMEDSDEKEKA